MNVKSVTFDTNVFNFILDPEACTDNVLKHKSIEIRSLIESGYIKPYVSETIFNLEDLEKKVRPEFFGSYEPLVKIENIQTENPLVINQRVSISPNTLTRPASNSFWMQKIKNARELGFIVLSAPRIGMTRNTSLLKSDFGQRDQDQMRKQQSRFYEACEYVSQLGAGIEIARKLGNESRTNETTWYSALSKSSVKSVAKAIAEWSDGDSVATHISYGIDIFCTRDNARNAGLESVFSDVNRKKLNHSHPTA